MPSGIACLSSLASRKITERNRALAKKREELARVIERLAAPDLRPGIANELRQHVDKLEREIAELTISPRSDDQS